MANIVERRPKAKINLALAVQGRRPDGFHDIRSWVVKLDWSDRLILTESDTLSLEVESNDRSIPPGPDNLVWKASTAMAERAGRNPGVAIKLIKNIPAGAGLGGGSSDAAETLAGLNELWRLGLAASRLREIGAELGSDVPLFLMPDAVEMAGRGEQLKPVELSWRGWFVVAVPEFPLATAEVYKAWAAHGTSSTIPSTNRLVEARTAAELGPLLFNDLESPAFAIQPKLRELHARLSGLGGATVRMTGSGSALFALFDDRESAAAWRHRATRMIPAGVTFHISRVL